MKNKLKIIAALLVGVFIFCVATQAAEYTNRFSVNMYLDTAHYDSSSRLDSLSGAPTFLTPATTGRPIFHFVDLENTNSNIMSGVIGVRVTARDTNASGEYIDTAKDTIIAYGYTSWLNRAVERLRVTCTLVPTTGTSFLYKPFQTSSDSALGEAWSWKILTRIQDTDNSVARSACKVTYQLTTKMIVR